MLKKLGKWSILLFAVVLGLILSLLNFYAFNPAKEYASASIELLYPGAQEGKAPNGQSFSISTIEEESFLEKAIEKAGLAGTLTVKDLSANMAVRGSYPKDIINQIKNWDSLLTADPTRVVRLTDYYPTVYKVTIYNELSAKLSKAQLTGLVNTIVEQYKEQYQSMYGAGVDWSSVNGLYSTGNRDYMQDVDLLVAKTKLIDKHAKALYEVKPSFSFRGTTFTTLSTRAQSILTNDLQSLAANITLNALSNDADALRQKYVYEMETLTREHSALSVDLKLVEALIEGYEMDSTIYMSSGDNIVTVEGNSKATYESLVQTKSELSARIASKQIEISDINSKIADLDAKTAEDGYDDAALRTSIAAADKRIEELISEFNALADAYNKEYASDSTIQSTQAVYHGSSLVSASFIKALIKSEAPVCAVALIVIFVIGLIQEGKKIRRSRKNAVKAKAEA